MRIEQIPEDPNVSYSFIPCCDQFSVNLQQSVKDRLEPGETELTNERALQIFTWIKRESDILSHLTMPFFAVPFSFALAIGAWGIPATTIMGMVVRMVVFSAAFSLVTSAVQSTCNGLLSKISRAYTEQGKLANRYIQTLSQQGVQSA